MNQKEGDFFLYLAENACGTFVKRLKNHNTGWPNPCELNWVDATVRKQSMIVLTQYNMPELKETGFVQLLNTPNYALSLRGSVGFEEINVSE